MTPRENLLKLYRRQGFEYIPVQMSFCPEIMKKFKNHYPDAPSPEEHFNFAARNIMGPGVVDRGSIDWTKYYPNTNFKKGTTFDSNGVAHEPGSEEAAHMTRMHHPMIEFDSLEQFQKFPYVAIDKTSWQVIKKMVDDIQSQGYAATGNMDCTIWETSWYMRSMEQLMVDMLDEDEIAVYHLDRVAQISCDRAEAYAKAGVDILHLGDDIGMQETIMMSTETYREWIKPRLRRVIDTAKSIKPDILIKYHSCGFVIPFIEDLIEVGVDILNPVQPECMDFKEIHDKFGQHLSFNGTIGTQTTMPFGTPEEVRQTVIRNLDIAGNKGGLLPCPTHLLEPEVPWENIEAYVNACKEYTAACNI